MSEHKWHDLAAAYALGALDEEERVAFEERLEEDGELKALVDEYRAASLAVGASLPAEDPPEALRQRIVERAARTPQEVDEAPPESNQESAARVVPISRRRGMVVSWLALAASVAGLIWVGAQNRTLRTEAANLRSEGDGLRTVIVAIRDSLSLAETQLAQLDSLALLLSGPDVRFASLTDQATQPSLRLVWNPDRDVLLVAASNLAQPAAGRTYQLWGIRGTDAPVSLGTFDPDADGSALLIQGIQIEPDFDVSAITDEPAGGSPGPTTTPFLVGAWRSAQD